MYQSFRSSSFSKTDVQASVLTISTNFSTNFRTNYFTNLLGIVEMICSVSQLCLTVLTSKGVHENFCWWY